MMAGWQESTLGQACELYQPKTISASDLMADGAYSVYGANGIIGKYDKFNHAEPQLLITCRGATCGSVNVSMPNSWITGNAMVVKPRNNSIDLRYLKHLFLGGLDLTAVITGAAQPQITRQSLAPLKIRVPPLPEQRRIADILDRADALRAKRRAALAHLDELAQAIFIQMFGDAVGHGWVISKVADIVDDNRGGIRTGPFGSQLLHSEFVDSGIAVLGIDNAVTNEFRWGERRFVTKEKYTALGRYTVFPGDVLITIMGTCGRCAVVPNDIPSSINTKHLCCITTDRSKCLPDFLHTYFLQHPMARDYLSRTAKGAIMDGLNMGLIKKMPFPLVPIPRQTAFLERLGQIRSQRDLFRKSQSVSDALFASLQHRAFRGEL